MKSVPLAIIIAIALFVGVWNPLGMNLNQNIVFASLIITVATWATQAVNKTYACLFLLAVFMIFGSTKPYDVLSFVWSDTILLIATTTLLSVGIMKTGIIHQYVEKLFRKSADSKLKLLLLPYLFGLLLVFLIPQAFARVIIIGAIFSQILEAKDENQSQAKSFLIFNGFLAVTMTYMFLSSGDIVLNQAALKFAGPEVQTVMTFNRWFSLMAVPSLIACVVMLAVTYFLFKKELNHFTPEMLQTSQQENKKATTADKVAMATMGLIILFWMTESIHHIRPWIPALFGVIVMFAGKILDKADLKSVNPHFIVFLITVFSIGKGLGQAGVTEIIFNHLKQWIPDAKSAMYLLVIAAIVMVLHICIGSSVATMSVVLPILIPLTASAGYNAQIITLMTYIIVNIHFLLPFHHATMMIGTAKQYYPDRYMLRLGTVMTILTFVLLAGVYFQWWKLMGLL
ncbi:SLC13 family permease [Vaginisenegalia massiliensis]|uniref:SLC13 family permease n=1 Tax=Vaginisenegalia massiliensis TaxID=2058294 RepID=UPI001F14F5B0|nr:SLC13 family permease [Vaginisenegalia massiliensis]